MRRSVAPLSLAPGSRPRGGTASVRVGTGRPEPGPAATTLAQVGFHKRTVLRFQKSHPPNSAEINILPVSDHTITRDRGSVSSPCSSGVCRSTAHNCRRRTTALNRLCRVKGLPRKRAGGQREIQPDIRIEREDMGEGLRSGRIHRGDMVRTDLAGAQARRFRASNGYLLLQCAPRLPTTTGTVLAMILRSSTAERRSMYSRSRSTFVRTSSTDRS